MDYFIIQNNNITNNLSLAQMIWIGSTQNPYKLSDLLRAGVGEPQGCIPCIYHAIKAWMVNKTTIPESNILIASFPGLPRSERTSLSLYGRPGNEANILIDHKVAGLYGCPLLCTSECKRPDLQLTSANNCILVQIEVEHGEYSQKARDRAGGPASLVEEPQDKHQEM